MEELHFSESQSSSHSARGRTSEQQNFYKILAPKYVSLVLLSFLFPKYPSYFGV